jgi:O-acetyl-ADP-ribose deacetylase (regulator of RNase III)
MIELIKGDITQLNVDAIVNAANNSLMGGGGVDGAIHRAGGPAIQQECRTIGGCATGEAVITTGGNLLAKHVIHTVGPVWQGGQKNEALLLQNCYFNSMSLASQHNFNSMAFPNISTGVYGFPKEAAAGIAIKAVRNFLAEHNVPSQIIFACFDEENFNLYRRLLNH